MDFSQDYSYNMFLWDLVMLTIALSILAAALSTLYGLISGLSRDAMYAVKSGLQIILIVVSIFTLGLFFNEAYHFTMQMHGIPFRSIWTSSILTKFIGFMFAGIICVLSVSILSLLIGTLLATGISSIKRSLRQ